MEPGTIRIIDLAFVGKDASGNTVDVFELSDLDPRNHHSSSAPRGAPSPAGCSTRKTWKAAAKELDQRSCRSPAARVGGRLGHESWRTRSATPAAAGARLSIASRARRRHRRPRVRPRPEARSLTEKEQRCPDHQGPGLVGMAARYGRRLRAPLTGSPGSCRGSAAPEVRRSGRGARRGLDGEPQQAPPPQQYAPPPPAAAPAEGADYMAEIEQSAQLRNAGA